MITDKKSAEKIAEALLEIGAVSLQPEEPFTWASGMRSPIYCDNRLTLAYPYVRGKISEGLANIIRTYFADAEVIAGTATAGIAHAALIANNLNLPMAYVRGQAKDHGRLNQIEGQILPKQNVVMVEDLISTGSSVLKATQAVEAAGAEVVGVVAIFNYNLVKGQKTFAEYQAGGLPLHTLSDFDALVQVARKQGSFSEAVLANLDTWSADPQGWDQRFSDAISDAK